jgi:hypothetical protein
VKGRDQPKGISQGKAQNRTQSRRILPLNLMRVNEAARHADLGYPWEEPYAGKPHVRICEGKSRMAELLDHPRALKGCSNVR